MKRQTRPHQESPTQWFLMEKEPGKEWLSKLTRRRWLKNHLVKRRAQVVKKTKMLPCSSRASKGSSRATKDSTSPMGTRAKEKERRGHAMSVARLATS